MAWVLQGNMTQQTEPEGVIKGSWKMMTCHLNYVTCAIQSPICPAELMAGQIGLEINQVTTSQWHVSWLLPSTSGFISDVGFYKLAQTTSFS